MNIIEGIQEEVKRVNEIIKEYEAIGPAGLFASTLMKQTVKEAEASVATGDTIKMIRCYKDLKEYES